MMKIVELKNVSKSLLFFLGTIGIVYIVVLSMSYISFALVSKVEKTGAVYIPTGSDLSQEAAVLVDHGYLKDTTEFLNFARKMNFTKVYPGKYSLEQGMTYFKLFRVIAGGHQTPVKLVFNNIDDVEALAGRLSSQIELDSLSIVAMLANDTLVSKFGLTPEKALYIFIPNTYEVYWNISQEKLLALMKKEYDRFWSDPARQEKLKSVPLTQEEVVTLASIVEKECYHDSDLPKVAGVYINRLNKNMRLQACPTVKFALKEKSLRRILYGHLKVDSPYNTYKNYGLPPTPICIPSIKAVEAVLNYEKSDYLYFCASEKLDMTHHFSASGAEHNLNAKRYAEALNRAGITE